MERSDHPYPPLSHPQPSYFPRMPLDVMSDGGKLARRVCQTVFIPGSDCGDNKRVSIGLFMKTYMEEESITESASKTKPSSNTRSPTLFQLSRIPTPHHLPPFSSLFGYILFIFFLFLIAILRTTTTVDSIQFNTL